MSDRRLRREITRRVENLSDSDLEDWALVYAINQRDWYRNHMRRDRNLFISVEFSALFLASIVTVLAALNVRPWLTASIAALLTFLSGFRQLALYQETWPAWADAWAQVNALASAYRVLPVEERSTDKQRQLVQAVNDVVLNETRRWKQTRLGGLRGRKDEDNPK
jgi:hypothetical protein